MRRTIIILSLITVVFMILPLTASAVPHHIDDNYWGYNDHGYGDIIGAANIFEIEWMEVEFDTETATLTVEIKTNYAGPSSYGGTDFGDLFISDGAWNPFGTAPYEDDYYLNGETWEYAFDVSEGDLYSITNSHDILLSENVISGGIFRNGQEVLINTDSAIQVPEVWGSAEYKPSDKIYEIKITGFPWNPLERTTGFHWGMTCANDVIEGNYKQIPDPTALVLLGSAMVVVGLAGRKKLLRMKV